MVMDQRVISYRLDESRKILNSGLPHAKIGDYLKSLGISGEDLLRGVSLTYEIHSIRNQQALAKKEKEISIPHLTSQKKLVEITYYRIKSLLTLLVDPDSDTYKSLHLHSEIPTNMTLWVKHMNSFYNALLKEHRLVARIQHHNFDINTLNVELDKIEDILFEWQSKNQVEETIAEYTVKKKRKVQELAKLLTGVKFSLKSLLSLGSISTYGHFHFSNK